MDIRQLRYFVEVVDKGTVTAAASALNMSQPPISVQIRSLEQELGCKLFDRSTRHIQLTEAGRTLYERACSILDLCTSAKNEIADLKTGTLGTLRLGVVSSVGTTLFLKWLRQFCMDHSRLRFELYEANTYQLLDKIRSKQIELAIIRTPFSAADLNCLCLRNEPLFAIGQPQFLSCDPDEPVSLLQLSRVPLLFYRRWEKIIMDVFLNSGYRPRVLCVSDDARTTVSLAEQGFGVGLVPQSGIPMDQGLQKNRIDHSDLQSEICVVHRKDIYISSVAKQFVESIKSCN
jgi:DNA-binding transcriptional LysR family regulator